MSNDMRVCKDCGQNKPLSEYHQSGKYKKLFCKECAIPRNRAYTLMNSYGLTIEEYDGMAANGCMACGSMENLHIDHDHSCCASHYKTCGKCIRGVLCKSCNIAEGYLKGDPDRALALAAYMLRAAEKVKN